MAVSVSTARCAGDPLRRGRLSGRAARGLRLGAAGRTSSRGIGRRAALPLGRRGAADRRHHAPAGARRDPARDRERRRRARSTKAPIADDIVGDGRGARRCSRAEDFARHRGDVVEPISHELSRPRVFELPPNGQGLTALVMLNILEQFDLAALDPSGRSASTSCSKPRAWPIAVRDAHVADPAHMRVPVPALLDKTFATELAVRIDPTRRVPLPRSADARQRHHLSHGGRSRPHGGVASSIRCTPRSAPASAPRRPASCCTIAAPASCSSPAIRTRSARASGRCTRSFRRWPCATGAATCRSA